MSAQPNDLLKTPLYDCHLEHGAKMVPFAGYSMPVQYRPGIIKEHLHTREQAGLFDVSHMGQVRLTGDGIAEALERVLPQDIIALAPDRQRYALLMNESGGIRDDLMVANCGDHFMMVLNAACKHDDFFWLRQSLPADIDMEMLEDRALIALQGPKARESLTQLAPEVADMTFMQTGTVQVAGSECWVSCSGYTGEDGFEISAPAGAAPDLFERLTALEAVAPVGLGARDSLRLEAGLCLYGHDLDENTSPVEASLKWAISPARRPGGERAGGYPGAERVAREWEHGTTRRRTLLAVEGRVPVREGTGIVDDQGEPLGTVTSGGFGPSVGAPVAMGYVASEALASGTSLFAEVRNKRIPLSATGKPFVQQRYYRGR